MKPQTFSQMLKYRVGSIVKCLHAKNSPFENQISRLLTIFHSL